MSEVQHWLQAKGSSDLRGRNVSTAVVDNHATSYDSEGAFLDNQAFPEVRLGTQNHQGVRHGSGMHEEIMGDGLQAAAGTTGTTQASKIDSETLKQSNRNNRRPWDATDRHQSTVR